MSVGFQPAGFQVFVGCGFFGERRRIFISILGEGGAVFGLFLHIGIDSINLNGNGFKAFVQEGDIVNEGDLLIEFPLDEIREKLKSPMIPVIFKGLSKEKFIYFNNDIDVKSGDINKVEIHEKLNN